MTVKRYTPTQCCEHDGTYVTYSDYQKLVAENSALRRIALGYHILTVPEREAPTEPEIDADIAEIMAQGVDALALHMEFNGYSNEASGAREFAANLRAGRKG